MRLAKKKESIADVSEQFVVDTIYTFLRKASSLSDAINQAAAYLNRPVAEVQAIANLWDVTMEQKVESKKSEEMVLQEDLFIESENLLLEKGDKIVINPSE